MRPTVRQALAEIPCQVCGTRPADRDDHVIIIHIRYDHIRAAEDGGPTARWQAHCMDCNPHQHEDDYEHKGYVCLYCYCFDLNNTLDWNEHLHGKNWIQYTDWDEFAWSGM